MKKLFLLIAFAGAVACSSSKKTSASLSNSNGTVSATDTASSVPDEDRDGSSFSKAIVITEKSETAGVGAEYAWLRKHYPGYKSLGQALIYQGKKPFDVLTIETKDGEKKEVYFDISNFFGKF